MYDLEHRCSCRGWNPPLWRLIGPSIGYDYYVTLKDADEEMQRLAEEMGLADIPGVSLDDRAQVGLAASVAGAVVALSGGVVLAYGLLKKTEDITTPLNPVPGSVNFCKHCTCQISSDAVSCTGCGRQLVPP